MKASTTFAPFRTRLRLMVLLLAIPCFALVLWGNLEQRRIERQRVRDGAVAISQLAAAYEQKYVDNTRQLLITLSQTTFLVLASNRTFAEAHMANLRKLSPDYVNFGLIEANGQLFCSAEPTNVPVNLGDRTYFQRVMRTRRFASGDFQIGRLTGEPALAFGYPIFDDQGRLARVLFASLAASRLSSAVNQIPLPQDASVTIFDRVGVVVAHYPNAEEWVGKSLTNAPVVKRILTNGAGVFEMTGVDGVAHLHAVTPITDSQSTALLVSVAIPLTTSFAPADEALVRNLLILGFVAVSIFVVGRFYANHYFLRPVNALAEAAGKVAEGDFSARAGSIEGARELVQLGRAFDDMAARLQKRQAELEAANQEIKHLNQDLEKRVTERTGQLEAANKELEAFSYSVSHDLRAPLRHIDGFVGMLNRESGQKLEDKSRRYLDIIGTAARQMSGLIDDLLVFSRMGRTEVRWSNVDPNELVKHSLETLHSELSGRNVIWHIDPLPCVQADPTLFQQVWSNLLNNAVKYSRTRDPAEIEIRCAAQTPEEFIFLVRDNGVGFDMKYANKLFGVFQRLHRADEFEGTGIGLANVRRIVQRHGGRTWAEAELGTGATFYFTLPRQPSSSTG